MKGEPGKSVLAFDVGGINFQHALVEEGINFQFKKTIPTSFSNFPENSPREIVSESSK